ISCRSTMSDVEIGEDAGNPAAIDGSLRSRLIETRVAVFTQLDAAATRSHADDSGYRFRGRWHVTTTPQARSMSLRGLEKVSVHPNRVYGSARVRELELRSPSIIVADQENRF